MENAPKLPPDASLSEIVEHLKKQKPVKAVTVRRKRVKPLPFLHVFRVNFDYMKDGELVEFMQSLFIYFFDRREPPKQTSELLEYCFRGAKIMLSAPENWNLPEVRKFFLPLRFRAIFDGLKTDKLRAELMRRICAYAFDGEEGENVDGELAPALENAKQALAEENLRREQISAVRSEAGRLGAEASLKTRFGANPETPKANG